MTTSTKANIFSVVVAVVLTSFFTFSLTYRAAPQTVVPALPSHLDINGVNWVIEKDPLMLGDAARLIGRTDCRGHRIYVRSSAGVDVRSVLFHELSHAMVCFSGPEGTGADNLYFNSLTNDAHEGIYNYTDAWRETFKRNPGLGSYLGGTD